MTWYMIRLDLARSETFPTGSAAHSYLLRLPLDGDGHVDADAVRHAPAQATVLRSLPDAPEQAGYVLHRGKRWLFSYAPGEEDDEALFHLETHRLVTGDYVTVTEPDGTAQCFVVASCQELAGT
ncbi:MAG: hypothetical protein V4459_14505 [Pseudomonadota bacterium]